MYITSLMVSDVIAARTSSFITDWSAEATTVLIVAFTAWRFLQESLAARVYDGWSHNKSVQAKRQRAKLLRGIRLGSMMHGTPEAIPVQKPVGWMKDPERRDGALDMMYDLLMEDGRSDVLEWDGVTYDNLFAFTPPQVAELQKKLKELQSPQDARITAASRQRTVDDISSLVDAAVARGDDVLFQHSGLAYIIGMTFVLNPVDAQDLNPVEAEE